MTTASPASSEPVATRPADRPDRVHRLERFSLALVLAVSAGFVALFLVTASRRMTYRFELEWLEGLTIDHAWRILHGLPIYSAPDATFAPNTYPPLYYLVALPALVATGWSLEGARLVSLASVLGSGIVTVLALRRDGISAPAVLLALGVEGAFYPVTLYWYELARVDSLQTFLLLAGVAILASNAARPAGRHIILGAFLLALGVFTKQTTVHVCLASLAYFAWKRDWRRSRQLALALIAFGAAGGAALLTWAPDALAFIVGMPASDYWGIRLGLPQIAGLVWRAAPFLALSLYALPGAGRGQRVARASSASLFVATLAGALVAAMTTLCKVGGRTNSAMPAIFLLAITAGYGADGLWRRFADARALRAAMAFGLAVFMVFAFRADFASAVPTRADRELAESLWHDMEQQPGPFLAYEHSFVSTVLRGETYPSADRLWDYAGGYVRWLAPVRLTGYPPELLWAIEERRFTAIYTAGEFLADPVNGLIRKRYRPDPRFGELPGPAAPRWKRCLPRLKWVPAEPTAS